MAFINRYEPMNALASYYSPLFPPHIRTPYFLNIFAECFGTNSSICNDYPRPIMCQQCIQKYIKNCNIIIKQLDNNEEVLTNLKMILTRFLDLNEQLEMLMEHAQASEEQLNTDIVYQFFDIDMEAYDPPSKNIINQCNTFNYVEDENNSCVVCLCEYEKDEQIKKLLCGHTFHEECIMTWFKNHSTCPICKASLKEEVEEVKLEPYHFLKNEDINDDNDDINDDIQIIEVDDIEVLRLIYNLIQNYSNEI